MEKKSKAGELLKLILLIVFTLFAVFAKRSLDTAFSDTAVAAWRDENGIDGISSEKRDALLVFFDKSSILNERGETSTLV